MLASGVVLLSADSSWMTGKPEIIRLAEKWFYKRRMGWLM
jgi:hypothetical protein